ncbi:hypothetical protein B0H19DRAFT_1065809 [Mycena capillaripes]|nr:hypothetical protein B0H19DRAFT_1065809 [Mycena capillaripes]
MPSPLNSSPCRPTAPSETSEEQVDWSEELAQGTAESIFRWKNGGKETPLIFIHAVNFQELQRQGPYRLPSYSGSSILAIPLAQMLQEAGGTLIQFAYIDHFPLLLLFPGIGFHIKENQPLDFSPAGRRAFLAMSFDGTFRMIRSDGDGNVARRHKLASDLMGAFHGHPNSEFVATFYKTIEDLVHSGLEFLLSLVKARGESQLLNSLVDWIETVKAPVTVYVASNGMLSIVEPDYSEQWTDLGVNLCHNKPRVVYLDANDFDVLADKRLLSDLQRDYLPAEANL